MLTKTHLISLSALFISIFTAIVGLSSASIALIVLIIAFQLKTYFNGGTCSIVKDLTGKVVIVTGARTGVGRETARALARMNATVILACRGLKTALPVLEELRADTKNDKLEMLELDLDDLQSIRRFAETFKSKYNRLDILINNAGVMAVQERKLTKHGYELQFGTNHLGHFYLTSLLLDLIKKSAPSRIVNVSSRAQREGVMHWDDLMLKGNYTPWRAYRQSKLANVIFSKELQRRMDLEKADVQVVSLHPGAVRTELGRHMAENPVLRYSYYALYLVYLYMTKSAMQGAQTTLYCALEDQDKLVGGEYYSDCKPSKVNQAALVEENGKKLWEVSENLIQESLIEKTYKFFYYKRILSIQYMLF